MQPFVDGAIGQPMLLQIYLDMPQHRNVSVSLALQYTIARCTRATEILPS